MIGDNIRWSLKRKARRWAGRLSTLRGGPSAPVVVAPEPLPEPAVDFSDLAPSPDVEATSEPAPDESGMTMEAVQTILDDLIRPALQSDGGDCTLMQIKNNDVYLKLLGACDGCPSATITLKMGIETVLKEEFPQMNDLISVEHGL